MIPQRRPETVAAGGAGAVAATVRGDVVVEILPDGVVDRGVGVPVVADGDNVIRVPPFDAVGDVAQRRAGGEVADDGKAREQPATFQHFDDGANGAAKRAASGFSRTHERLP